MSTKPRSYRIQVRYRADAPWHVLYTGPWNSRAQYIWTNTAAPRRRVIAVLTDADTQAVFYGHPDLIEVEKHLDRYYQIEGDPADPPNRLADFDRLTALQECEGRAA